MISKQVKSSLRNCKIWFRPWFLSTLPWMRLGSAENTLGWLEMLRAIWKCGLWKVRSPNFLFVKKFLFLFPIRNLKNNYFSVFDSSGRVPSSLLSGNVNQFGDFDQCLRIEHQPHGSAETIKGQYVLAYLDLQVSNKVNNPQLKHLLTLAHSYDVITSNFSDVSATVGTPP